MDPDEALKNARTALKNYRELESFEQKTNNERDRDLEIMCADDMFDAFEALDGWLSKGGFPPKAWDRNLAPEGTEVE
jgi:hypothetical protein